MSFKFLRSYKTGVSGAIVTASWDAFWLIGPPVGIDAASRRAYLIWGFAAFVLCIGQALYALITENNRLNAEREPKFEIVFRPEDETDSRPYLQRMEYPRNSGPGSPYSTWIDRRYRVGIVNLSSAIVPNVRLVLAKCDPSGNFIHVGHRLQVTDSDPILGERDLAPNPNGEATVFFDVVSETAHERDIPTVFTFCFANPNISGPVEYDLHHAREGEFEFKILLRAEGGGYSHERWFRVSKNFDGRRHLWGRLKMEAL